MFIQFSCLQEDYFQLHISTELHRKFDNSRERKIKMHRFIVVRNDGSFAQTLNHGMMKIDQLNETW